MPELALGGSPRRGDHPAMQPGQVLDNQSHRAPQQHLSLPQLEMAQQHLKTGKPQAVTEPVLAGERHGLEESLEDLVPIALLQDRQHRHGMTLGSPHGAAGLSVLQAWLATPGLANHR